MSVQTLYRSQAFGPGAQLWVIPAEQKSALIKKMNWYLNFQLSVASRRQPLQVAPQIQAIMTENHMPNCAPVLSDKPPLLIYAQPYLPVDYVVELTTEESPIPWLKKLHAMWFNFKSPELRVFLPPGLSPDDFEKFWKDKSRLDVTVVSL